jgi:AcrR family transcriptional regulator
VAKTRKPAEPAPTSEVAERLLSTACALFYREGIQAVGVQRLIDEAGIAKASFYTHFPSKDDLVAAYLDRNGAAWRAKVQAEVLDLDLNPRARLRRMLDVQTSWIESEQFRGCPFQKVGSELSELSATARRVTEGHRHWQQRLYHDLVEAAGIRPVEPVAGALLVLFDGAAVTALVDRNPAAVRDARWAAELILEKGLSSDE